MAQNRWDQIGNCIISCCSFEWYYFDELWQVVSRKYFVEGFRISSDAWSRRRNPSLRFLTLIIGRNMELSQWSVKQRWLVVVERNPLCAFNNIRRLAICDCHQKVFGNWLNFQFAAYKLFSHCSTRWQHRIINKRHSLAALINLLIFLLWSTMVHAPSRVKQEQLRKRRNNLLRRHNDF